MLHRLLVPLLAILLPTLASAQSATASLTANTTSYAAAGGTVTFTATVVYPTGAGPAAIAWNIQLPEGWKFVSQSLPSGAATAAAPSVNDNTLEWAFSSFPATQLAFTFIASYPAGLNGNQTISVPDAQYRSPLTNLSVAPVVLTPAPTAPSFTLNPVAQTATVGGEATFTAAAVGFPAPTLQWRKNGTAIAGATAATLTLSNVKAADAANYDVVAANTAGSTPSTAAALTVNKATPVLAWSAPAAIVYGTALGDAQLNATVTGGIAGTFAYSPAAGARPAAGSATLSVTFTPTDAASYNPATATVTLSVTPAPLTVTASADAKVYGTARSFGPGATSFTATGLAPGDAITSVTLAASGGGAATDNVGTYTLTPSAPVGAAFNAANYSVSFATGTLTVTPKPLTITANNDTKVAGETRTYGAGSTAFTSSGLVSPQTIGSVTLAASGGAAAGDAPGTYTLTPSAATGGTFNAANYALTYAPGTLTVNASLLAATLTPAASTYSAAGGNLTLTARMVYPAANSTPSAIAWNIQLPSGWKFVSQTLPTGAATAAAPSVNDNTLEWAFSSFSTTQLEYSFVVSYPAGLSGDQTITVTGAQYRSPTTNLTVAPVVTTPAPTAPSFTLNPVAQTGEVGGNVTFTAAAVGFPAPTLQWRRNGTNLPGATAATLTLNAITSANGGTYDVVASNSAGTTPSSGALLTVFRAGQTLTFGPLAARPFGDPDTTLTGSSSAGLPLTYTSSNPAVATIVNGNTLRIVGAGTTAITASQAGNEDYTVAAPVFQELFVFKATANVVLGGLAQTYNRTERAVTATTTPSGLPVVITYAGTGNGRAPFDAGTWYVRCTIDHPNYQGSAEATLVVARATQTIDFAALSTKLFSDGSTTLVATSTSGLPVQLSIANPAVAALFGGVAGFVGVGTTDITATQPGDTNYEAATPVTRTLTVSPALQTITFAPLAARTYVPADTFTLAATSSSGLTVSFASSNPAVATVSGTTVTVTGAGTTTITATQAGNANYGPADPVARTLTVAKATATVSLAGLAATYDGTPKAANATTTPAGLTVQLSYGPAPGSATPPTGAGSYAVTATVNDANYEGSAAGTLVIAKAAQSIDFTAPAAKTFGDPAFGLVATASSGLGVSFTSSAPAVASVSGATVTLNTGGTVTFTATQAGNENYLPASPVERSLSVAKAAATVTLTPANLAVTFNGTPRAAAATTTPASLTLAFTYTPSGSGTPTNAAPTDAGSYAVTATIDDTRYQGSASGTLVVAKADQTITFAELTSRPLDAGSFSLVASASSGLPVSFTTSSPSSGTVASVSGTTATLVNTGNLTLTATQPGNANYNAAPDVARILTVLSQSQTVSFEAAQLPGKTFGAAPFAIQATSNRGLLVSFASSDPAVATVGAAILTGTVSSAEVTILSAGNATITASQAGNADNAAATPVARTLTVGKATAGVTLGNLTASYDGTPRAVSAQTSPAGLNVVFSYGASPGSATPPTNAGTYPVTASVQEANYVGSATGNLVISKANQTISFASVGSPRLIDAGPVALSASASSGGNVTFTSSNTAVATLSGNSVVLTGIGNTTLTARQAGDANYNAAPDVTQTLAVNPVAPQIVRAPTAAPTAIQGSSFYFGPFALNALSSPATFSATGRPAGVSIDALTGELSGTPTQTGTFTLVVTATNVTGSDSRSYSLVVQPPAPVITSPAAATAVAGTAFSYTTVTVPPTGITFTAGGLPAGWALSGAGVLTGTPTSAAPITVTITASNATGAAILPLVISPTLPPNAPAYAGPAAVAGTVGEALNFTANFGSGTTVYAVTAGNLPPGLSLNSGTGAVTGTPTTAGVFATTLSATRSGLVALAEISFQINPPATAPVVVVTGGNVRTGTVGTALGPIALTASPAATSFNIGTLPAGLSAGGTPTAPSISGTPTLPGVFNVSLTASNAAGAGPVTALAVSIDPHPQAPRINSSAIVAGRVGQALSYQLTSLPAGPATYSAASALPAGLTLDAATGQVTGTPAPEALGARKVYFTGTNTFGTGPGLEVTFQIDPPLTVPVITSSGTAVAEVGKAFNYQITATNTPLSFTAEGLPTGLTLAAGGLISGVPASATGGAPLAITLRGANSDGTGDPKTLRLTILPPAATPVITSAVEVNARAGSAFSYQITATESPTSFVASPLPAGLSLSPTSGLISGTPTTAGTARLGLQAANGQGLGAVAGLTIDVAAATATPAVTSAATVSGQVGATLDYQVTGAPGPLTAYRLEGTLPAGLSFNSVSGRLSGSPTTAGQSTVRLFVRNASGEGFPQDLLVNILPSPAVPVITSAGQLDARVGAAVTYQITATNPPHTALEAFELPAGLAVNPNTGLIEGTPRSALTPVVQARLVGTNASGSGPARTLEIRIEPSLTAPVITNSPSTPAKVGQALSFQISATNSPTGFELRDAPAWMTLDAPTGRLGGTPTAPADARVTLLARNAAGESGPFALLVEVNPVDGAPAFTGSRTLYGTAGTALSAYRLSASNTPTSFLVVGLPEGLAVTRRTEGAVNIWEITGTPRRAGRFLLEVTPANAAGVGKTVILTLEITGHISFGS